MDSNPADYVKLPTDHNTGRAGTHDDPTQFLTAAQVSALAAATPWPYNVYVHLAAWSGLRAAELAGLQIGDVTLPPPPVNPNARLKPGQVAVERTAVWLGPKDLDGKVPGWKYVTPQDQGLTASGAATRSDHGAAAGLRGDAPASV